MQPPTPTSGGERRTAVRRCEPAYFGEASLGSFTIREWDHRSTSRSARRGPGRATVGGGRVSELRAGSGALFIDVSAPKAFAATLYRAAWLPPETAVDCTATRQGSAGRDAGRGGRNSENRGHHTSEHASPRSWKRHCESAWGESGESQSDAPRVNQAALALGPAIRMTPPRRRTIRRGPIFRRAKQTGREPRPRTCPPATPPVRSSRRM